VLDGQARTADATANTNCEYLLLTAANFFLFVRSHPELAMKFIELLCQKLRWTSDQVEQVILQNLPGRLASASFVWPRKHKLAPGDQTIAVTQQEMSRDGRHDSRKHQQAVCGFGLTANGFVSSMAPSVVWMPSRFRRWSKQDREARAIEHDPKGGYGFSEKIMLGSENR